MIERGLLDHPGVDIGPAVCFSRVDGTRPQRASYTAFAFKVLEIYSAVELAALYFHSSAGRVGASRADGEAGAVG